MNTHFYEHHDGRKGEGYSIYSAITKALGLEATILKISDPVWQDQPDHSRKATIREKSSGRRVGTMIIPHPDPKARKQ